jgi:hypothetical protein
MNVQCRLSSAPKLMTELESESESEAESELMVIFSG